MWKVKDGRLYCGGEPIAVRRVIVEMVMRRSKQPPTDEMVRHMLRMERAMSLRGLSSQLTDSAPE